MEINMEKPFNLGVSLNSPEKLRRSQAMLQVIKEYKIREGHEIDDWLLLKEAYDNRIEGSLKYYQEYILKAKAHIDMVEQFIFYPYIMMAERNLPWKKH